MKSYSYEENLKSFPIRDHFRIRGENMTRIEVFTDAAFAFAVTLLVFSNDGVPQSFDQFLLLLKDIPAFAVSFAQLVFFWYAHRVWSQRYGLEDLKTVFISCLLVFTVMVFVVPLKISYAAFLNWLSGGYFPSPIKLRLEDLQTFFAVFHTAFLSMCLIMLWLYFHALKKKEELMLNQVELFETHSHKAAWIIMSLTSLIALIITLSVPIQYTPFAGMIYGTLGITMSYNSVKREKLKKTMLASSNKTTEPKGI